MRLAALATLASLAVVRAASAQPAIDLEEVTQDALGPLTGITHAGDESGRLFLTEQTGRIRILVESSVLPVPFLDVSGAISGGGERGLLSLAFHPDYAENGFFYVSYTDTFGDTAVVRYSVSSEDPDVADPASASVVLTQQQPFANHNGGQLQFGPDGYLYVGMGDGGSGNDPQGNAQNPGTLLGKLLRIDVDSGEPYAIPEDNPFVADPSFRPEIWALGLRNPWRFSFDRVTGDLFIADVGQSAREEVNFEPAGSAGGHNYGWVNMEGSICRLTAGGCDGYTAPVLEYSHVQGCSITGGYRYRGLRYPPLAGYYLYADFCSDRLWAAIESDGEWSAWPYELGMDLPISTFGEDEIGTLYLGTTDGRLYRIASGAPFVRADLGGTGAAALFFQNEETGATTSFTMHSVYGEPEWVITEGLADPRWRLVGTHDFDRDGDTDLVWQHLAGGWLAVSHLDGPDPVDTELFEPQRDPDLSWRVVATGDMDLDGAADLLWRHVDGRLRVWLMDGRIRREEVDLFDGLPVGPSWDLRAAVDLSNDGRLDLLFYEPTQRWIATLLMNGTRFLEGRPITPGIAPDQYRLAVAADISPHRTDALVWAWGGGVSLLSATYMEGTEIVGARWLFHPPTSPPSGPGWLLVGPR